MMEQPSLAYCVHLSRLLHMPTVDIMKLDSKELVYQQAFDLIHTDEFKTKYELERQQQMSAEEHEKMLREMFDE